MKENKNFDRIEAYLFGRMGETEKQEFEREAAQNSELAEELALQRLEHRSMRMLLHQDLRANMAAWKEEKAELQVSEQGAGQAGAKVVGFRRRVLAFAAAACILLLAGFFVNKWLSAPDFGGMADNLFEETGATVRGVDRGAGQAVADAVAAMQQKDYGRALAQLQSVSDTAYQDMTLFLKGECEYRLGNLPQAAANFQQVIQSSPKATNRQKAEWYLLLTYLKMDRNGSAFKNLLDKLVNEPGHAFNREAVRLREQLQ